MLSCQEVETIHLRKKVIKKIYPAIVEVVVPKKEDKDIIYQRPLPFDQLDFKERNDKYHAIGTAFFISPTRLISAAHVIPADEFSVHKEYFIRTNNGTVHQLKTIYRYSSYRDLIEFDLADYPKQITSLKLADKVEIGDMVYAVGNAQGEGISTRGGQVSTFTPEHVAGQWEYIRFSSPASPGNSGGPLVNSKGEVVGIIVMKNNSENLNFALPVKEISKSSTEKAHFFERQLKVQDGMQVITKDWHFYTELPSTFSELSAKAKPQKDIFFKNLIQEFKEKFKPLIFPNNERFRDALLYQKLYPRLSLVTKDQALHDWKVEPISLKKIIVSKDNILYHSKGEIFHHYVLFKSDDDKGPQELLNSPRILLNRVLKASGAHRYFAGQRIPILDHGEPDESFVWTDLLGRVWRTNFWITEYENSLLVSHCSPTPEGVYCFMDTAYASQRYSGYMAFVKENILEINLSYSGTADEWLAFQKLPSKILPEILNGVSFKRLGKRIEITTPSWSMTTPEISSSKNSRLSLLVSYSPQSLAASNIEGLEVLIDRHRGLGATIFKAYEVKSLAPDHEIERWKDISNRSGKYDGKIHPLGDRNIKRIPIARMDSTHVIRGDQTETVKAQMWSSCYAVNNIPRQKVNSLCKTIKDSFDYKGLQ